MLERTMYDLTNEELCDLWCGQVEDEDYEYEEKGEEEYEDNKQYIG